MLSGPILHQMWAEKHRSNQNQLRTKKQGDEFYGREGSHLAGLLALLVYYLKHACSWADWEFSEISPAIYKG